jgi:hypothetical protein
MARIFLSQELPGKKHISGDTKLLPIAKFETFQET